MDDNSPAIDRPRLRLVPGPAAAPLSPSRCPSPVPPGSAFQPGPLFQPGSATLAASASGWESLPDPGDDPLWTAPAPPAVWCVRTLSTPDRTVVQLRGEIDIATTQLVTPHLDAATAADRPQVVVDLRAVTFIDCSGLRPLYRARLRTLRRGGRLSLICTDPRTLRILRLVGLIPDLPLAVPTGVTVHPGA